MGHSRKYYYLPIQMFTHRNDATSPTSSTPIVFYKIKIHTSLAMFFRDLHASDWIRFTGDNKCQASGPHGAML